jgi:hypothetical protein
MDKSISRIISKAGFLLIMIGLFMPLLLNKNVFQISEYLSMLIGKNAISISFYSIFGIAFIGALLFILLLMKNKISFIFDCVLIIAVFIPVIVILSEISRILHSMSNVVIASELFQSGAYIMLFGLSISTIFNLIATFTYESNNIITYDFKSIFIVLFLILSIFGSISLAIIIG